MPVRLIHVGLGGWGGNWARSVVPTVGEVEVVAVVDPHGPTLDAVVADLSLDPSRAFPALSQAIGAVDADAVVITSPAVTHVPLALEALDAGLHVLVEKPLANSLAEAITAAERAEGLGLILQVSQNYRHYPAPKLARTLVHDGAVGELSAINIDFRQWDNDEPAATHRHYAFPHPLIADMAIHHFDLLRMVTGREAVSVYAKTSSPRFSKYAQEASAAIVIELDGGLVVSYRGSWLSRGTPTPWAGEWRIEGESGEIFFTSRGGGEKEDASGDVVTLRTPGGRRVRPLPLEESDLYDRAAVLREFARAVRGGAAPQTTARDNIGSLAIMDAALRSASSGRAEPVVLHRPATKENRP